MSFHQLALNPPTACAALQRSRRRLRARIIALLSGPDANIALRFPATVAAVEACFRQEEALRELLGDACLHPRRADHAIVLSALHRTALRVESGDVRQGRQVLDALSHVLALAWPVEPRPATARHTPASGHPRHPLSLS